MIQSYDSHIITGQVDSRSDPVGNHSLDIAILIYNLYKVKHSGDPKEELLNAKKLLDENLITAADYEKINGKLAKRIVDD